MAASGTLPQAVFSCKSSIGRRGILTLAGFGIKIRMQAGHLEVEDGTGPERRAIRFARVGHNLKRLVCVSEDGFVTLAALKWISDVGASFVMLNRNGKVLFATGPNAPSDVRLRRAQAVAHTSGAALRISRELIEQKLAGQEQVARHKLIALGCADKIHCYRSELAEADDLDRVRLIESRAAAVYWSAYRNLPIIFPTKDQPRIPAHWKVFATRVSPLTGSPRLAINPVNGILNYLYSLLESEARLAATALGLDPGFGLLHVDIKTRSSFACDLMEPVRPQVDAYLARLDYARAAETSMVFRNARWQLSVDDTFHRSLVRNYADVGSCSCTVCGVGRSCAVVKFGQAQTRNRSTYAVNSAHEARGERRATIATADQSATARQSLSRMWKDDPRRTHQLCSLRRWLRNHEHA